MKANPLAKAIELAGGQNQLAARMNELLGQPDKIRQQYISKWLQEGTPVKWAPLVAAAVNYKVAPDKLAAWKVEKKLAKHLSASV